MTHAPHKEPVRRWPGSSSLATRMEPYKGDGGRRPSRFTRSGLRKRHLRAHVAVAVWAFLGLLAATGQQTLPVARWLAVHLFLLGAATTAVVVWSEHFAVALLHAPRPNERWSDARLAWVTLGTVGIVAGVWADLPLLIGVGCLLLVVAVVAHLVVLVRLGRAALGGRLSGVAAFYKAGTVALIAGAVLGGLLATGGAGVGHYAGLRLAHIHLTLLGWLGLPIVGTLFMLWPTVLGVRMAEYTTRVGWWVLRLAGGGLLVAVVAMSFGWRAPAAAGVGAYMVAMGLCLELFTRTAAVTRAHGRSPVSPAAVGSLGAAVGWLTVGLIADTVVLATRPLAEAQGSVNSQILPMLIGTVVQILMGALTYLLPVVFGSGRANRVALRRVLELGWRTRLVAFNLGALLMALPLPARIGQAGLVLTALTAVMFLTLVVAVTVRTRADAGSGAGASRRGGENTRGARNNRSARNGVSGETGATAGNGENAKHDGDVAYGGTAAYAGTASSTKETEVAEEAEQPRKAREAGEPGGAGGAGGSQPQGEPDMSPRWPAWAGTAVGVVVTLLAVLLANSGGTGQDSTDPVSASVNGSTASVSRTVDVTLANMRVEPSRVEVAPGTTLRLKVTNKDSMRHDLKVENGPQTPMLAKGESHTLDLGRITGDRTAWCTVPGHRAAGMTMDIVVKGTAAGTDSGKASGTDSGGAGATTGMEGHDMSGMDMSSSAGGIDFMGSFSKDFRARDPELAPVPSGTVHKLELHATRKTLEVAPGVKQEMWTFGDTVPGPTLHGKVGDTFEVTLVNDDPNMGHGIDFHPGRLSPDKPMRTINPGERLVYTFRAEKAGAWLYHCSTMPMLQHMGNGMYGAVVIDPPDAPKVDREYVMVSSELYLGTPGSTEQVKKMRLNTPDAWMFNGAASQYAQNPLKVKAGERVRFWMVTAGPSDGVNFHIVGTIFDTVYKEGKQLLSPGDPGGAQGLDLGPAQGGYVETVFPAPGHYSFVDHDMRRAEAGARGIVEVTK